MYFCNSTPLMPHVTFNFFVLSSFEIILKRMRELVSLISLSNGCLVNVNILSLFLTVPWVGLRCTHAAVGATYYIFTVLIWRKLPLVQASCVTVKLNFWPYIWWYASPNEHFEYSYPLIYCRRVDFLWSVGPSMVKHLQTAFTLRGTEAGEECWLKPIRYSMLYWRKRIGRRFL